MRWWTTSVHSFLSAGAHLTALIWYHGALWPSLFSGIYSCAAAHQSRYSAPTVASVCTLSVATNMWSSAFNSIQRIISRSIINLFFVCGEFEREFYFHFPLQLLSCDKKGSVIKWDYEDGVQLKVSIDILKFMHNFYYYFQLYWFIFHYLSDQKYRLKREVSVFFSPQSSTNWFVASKAEGQGIALFWVMFLITSFFLLPWWDLLLY